MNFKSFFRNKEDSINSGLKYFLDYTNDFQAKKTKFLNSNNDLQTEIVDQYFNQYKELQNFAESELFRLRKNFGETDITRQKFASSIAFEYKWISTANIKRLYDVCVFQNR